MPATENQRLVYRDKFKSLFNESASKSGVALRFPPQSKNWVAVQFASRPYLCLSVSIRG
jgi:hypothetical protein